MALRINRLKAIDLMRGGPRSCKTLARLAKRAGG
jgi:hypothetical protein